MTNKCTIISQIRLDVIICEIIVCLLVIVQNKKKSPSSVLRNRGEVCTTPPLRPPRSWLYSEILLWWCTKDVKGKFVLIPTTTTYDGVEIKLHQFFILVTWRWAVSFAPWSLCLRGYIHGTRTVVGWVGSRIGLHILEKRNKSPSAAWNRTLVLKLSVKVHNS